MYDTVLTRYCMLIHRFEVAPKEDDEDSGEGEEEEEEEEDEPATLFYNTDEGGDKEKKDEKEKKEGPETAGLVCIVVFIKWWVESMKHTKEMGKEWTKYMCSYNE